jgi:hypothetical protein
MFCVGLAGRKLAVSLLAFEPSTIIGWLSRLDFGPNEAQPSLRRGCAPRSGDPAIQGQRPEMNHFFEIGPASLKPFIKGLRPS